MSEILYSSVYLCVMRNIQVSYYEQPLEVIHSTQKVITLINLQGLLIFNRVVTFLIEWNISRQPMLGCLRVQDHHQLIYLCPVEISRQ